MDTSILSFLLLAILQATFGDEAEATVVNPIIISREDWGAKASKKPPELLTRNPAPYVIIHHSATPGCATQPICKARVKSIQEYHVDMHNWDDIGYNFLVGEDGNAYVGRNWGIRGAHSKKFNAISIGICLIGNFEDREPNAAVVQATQWLIAHGVSHGQIAENYSLFGHYQTAATSCPGDNLYRLMRDWPHWVPGFYLFVDP